MQSEQITRMLRDVAAVTGELLDNSVEILSVHIGPAPLPPVINIMPGTYTRSLQAGAQRCELTGEYRISFQHVELAWIVADPTEPVFKGPLSGLNRCIRMLDEELGRPA